MRISDWSSDVCSSDLQERLAAAGAAVRSPEDIGRLHASGHPVVAEWIAEAAMHLAPMVAMLENLFDPESIVFGGALPDALTDALIEAMAPLPLSVASRRARALPRVIRGATGDRKSTRLNSSH